MDLSTYQVTTVFQGYMGMRESNWNNMDPLFCYCTGGPTEGSSNYRDSDPGSQAVDNSLVYRRICYRIQQKWEKVDCLQRKQYRDTQGLYAHWIWNAYSSYFPLPLTISFSFLYSPFLPPLLPHQLSYIPSCHLQLSFSPFLVAISAANRPPPQTPSSPLPSAATWLLPVGWILSSHSTEHFF